MKNVRRKVMAVLAGGLMFGVGATVTLAAWNDSEFATNEFVSGGFGIEGATDSATGTYAEHASADAAADLTFTLNDGQNLAPGDTVYAPFWVRLTATSSNNANLVSSGVTATDNTGTNATHISYEVRSIPANATCNATTAAAGTLVASGANLNAHTAGQPVTLATAPENAAGPPAQLCFVVTAGDQLEQSGATEATWTFQGTSTAPPSPSPSPSP